MAAFHFHIGQYYVERDHGAYWELPHHAASPLPGWITDLYDKSVSSTKRANLRILLTEMQKLLASREFEQIDLLLLNTELTRLPGEIVMGLYRASAPAKHKLRNWEAGASRALEELRRRGLPADSIMIGLFSRPNDAPPEPDT